MARHIRTETCEVHNPALMNSADCGLWQVRIAKSIVKAIPSILDGVTDTTIGETDERFLDLAREVRYVISGSSNHAHAAPRDCKARLHSLNDFRMFLARDCPTAAFLNLRSDR
jgi:hypothetical protein